MSSRAKSLLFLLLFLALSLGEGLPALVQLGEGAVTNDYGGSVHASDDHNAGYADIQGALSANERPG
jgi:hypothetical protein